MTYRVEKIQGCTVVFGRVPISVMAQILKSSGKDEVTSNELKNILGAAMVFGRPEDLKRLLLATPRKEIPDPFRSILGEGACNWVKSGAVGLSSNFMLYAMTGFNALSWLNGGAAHDRPDADYPHDPDDLSRCRRLLEASPELRPKLSFLTIASSQWAALVMHWDGICAQMDAEAPHWRAGQGSAPQTLALMRRIFES
jgi:hypothetical protein